MRAGEHQLERARGVLHYEVYGRGSPLVLCHALGTDARLWSAAIEALQESFRVVAYDLPGHGQSQPPQDGDYSFEAMADDVLALMDHLGVERASVAGISVGGEVAQVFAARNPDRMHKLVLCSTACFTSPERALLWQQRIAEVESQGMPAVAAAAVLRWFSSTFRQAQPQFVEEFRGRVAAMQPGAYIGIARTIQQMDLRPLISRIDCDTLVVCGDEDANTGPDAAATIVRHIPQAQLRIMRGVGHFPNLEAPQAFAPLLFEWLLSAPRVRLSGDHGTERNVS